MGNSEKIYTFNWKFFDKQSFLNFQKLKRIAIINGMPVENILNSMIENYVDNHGPSFEMVAEKELIEVLRGKKINFTRPMLKYYRENRILEQDGQSTWYTNGVNIVYDLDKTLKILEQRNPANGPKRSIKPAYST